MQAEINQKKSALYFLQGGGETGELIRNYDWANTPLGSPKYWPQSLKTTIGLLLNSKFPGFIFWGRDLICFYNDAFRPSLGTDGKHPAIGRRGAEVWSDIWPTIGPWLRQVLDEGEAVWMQNQLVPFYRNGRIEQIYWTFCYSPIHDESGDIGGVLVTCLETTETVKATEENRKLVAIVEASQEFIGLSAMDHSVEYANPAALRLLGWDTIEGKTIEDCVYPDDRPLASTVLATLRECGNATQEIRFLNEKTGEPFWVWWNGFMMKDANTGAPTGLATVSPEITARKKALQALQENEHNFRNLVLQAPVGLCIVTRNPFIVEVVNDMFLAVVGKQRNELEGKPYWQALREAAAEYEPILQKVFDTGVAFKGSEHRVQLVRNGKEEIVYISFVYQPMQEQGKVNKVMILGIDVTEEVVARKIIEGEGEKFKLAIDLASLGTFEVNMVTGDANVSERFNEIWGVPRRLRWNDYVSYVHPEDRHIREHAHETALNTGTLHYEARLLHQNGTVHWVKIKGQVIFDAHGNPVVITGVAQDITEEKNFAGELEKLVKERTTELENMNRELQRSNANLEEFAHAASHDLKEPIRKIHYFTDRLKEQCHGKLAPEDEQMFARIEKASGRMGALIDDLLLYSHVSQRPHAKEEVDMNEKIHRVLEDLELDIQQKNAVVHVNPLPVIKGYRRQLQQLFQNLLGNALKYSKQDESPVITISSAKVSGQQAGLTPSQRYYLIEVADNGIGFHQRDAERIFQMFQRLHGKSEYSGTGVGLAIAKKVVENHDGRIMAESEPGKGTRFKVYLPEIA